MIGRLMDWAVEGSIWRALLCAFLAVLVIGAPILAVAGYASMKAEQEWAAFAEANDCRVIREEGPRSSLAVGMATGGQAGMVVAPIVTAERTTWRCADGVEYVR